MIESLELTHFVLVDHLFVEFGQGFNVITGETGAGKSLIVKSLELLSGQPASEDYIYPDEDMACIEVRFLVPKGMSFDDVVLDDGRLIISRRIQRNRPTINKINYESVSLKKMKDVMKNLLFLTSQHQLYEFMNTSNHLKFFDQFIGSELTTQLNEYQTEYNDYKASHKRVKNMKEQSDELDKDILNLTDLIHDISNQKFSELEEEELIQQQKKHKTLKQQQVCIENISEITSQIMNLVSTLDKSIDELNQKLTGSIAFDSLLMLEYLRGLSDTISQEKMEIEFLQSIDLDQLNERLHCIFKYKLKYGVQSLKELLDLLNKSEATLSKISSNKKEQKILLEEYSKKKEMVNKLAVGLTRCRKKYEIQFNRAICTQLEELGMKGAIFQVEISLNDDGSIVGNDRIEFLFSGNPNMAPKPLHHTASGGELSRVMLALLVCNHEVLSQPLIVFDEIDTGIGGVTANYIGNTVANISKKSQLIVVTHLPQIARSADHHYKISKTIQNRVSCVKINKLNKENVTEELQRMVGGKAVAELIK